MSKIVKKRNWAFVLYPESAPENWREILTKTGLQCAVSPLHDKDINPTGEQKKAHYHIILCYAGPTSYNVVKALTDELNQPIPQSLEQVKGYYRYLTHKDNPEKYQYDEKDITTINGFSILDYTELSKTERREMKLKIQNVIRQIDIKEYSDLLNYLADNEMYEEYDFASDNTMLYTAYLASCRYTGNIILDKNGNYTNKETGEIIEEHKK